MIADDQTWFAAPRDHCGELPRHPTPRDRGVDHGGQTFLRHIVDHVDRITSYNVCYTKLLRIAARRIGEGFEDDIGRDVVGQMRH